MVHGDKQCCVRRSSPLSTRELQLATLSLGYATAVLAAGAALVLLCTRSDGEDLALAEEVNFASKIQRVLSGAFPAFDATFVGSLRTNWTATAMVQMRSARGLLDASETEQKFIEDSKTRWRKDVAHHGLKHCALPSCDKRAAVWIVFQVSLRVVLIRGARGAALGGAQAGLPRNHGRTAGCD